MSTLAITAAHFVAISVRYAVGRWYNIPTNTLLAYNAADLGLNMLGKVIGAYDKVDEWKLSLYQAATFVTIYRTCTMFSAFYITSKLADPMPGQCAVMSNVAAFISIYALVALANWRKGKVNNSNEGAF